MKTMLRGSSKLLGVVLLAILVVGCGNEALPQCEEKVSRVEENNQELQEALTQSRLENQKLQETLTQSRLENQELQETFTQSHLENIKLQEALSDAQVDNKELREELSRGQALSRTQPDLSWLRENLWRLFHDEGPALWECGESASQVTRAQAMPSASPDLMVQEINERFQALNPALESPELVLERMEGDTAVVTLKHSRVVTEQMGSTGAQCYFAGVTLSLTSFTNIDHVRFDIEPGNHGGPGRYDRADFVHLLPLELDPP